MSKVGKDFGCGFYLSSDKTQALEFAEQKTEQLGFGTPVLNVYDFDESCLTGTDLSVGRYDGYTLEWARFVLMNRKNRTRIQAHDYDIVIGPIANDAVGFYGRIEVHERCDDAVFFRNREGIEVSYKNR